MPEIAPSQAPLELHRPPLAAGSPHAASPVGPVLEPVRLAVRGTLARLPPPLAEFVLFGLKQAWACLFGAAMLGLLILTRYAWSPDFGIHRYDLLFAGALALQVAMLALRMETLEEARVILLYHVVGTAMEIFKTHMGSWIYPEPAIIRIGGVPLFTGFMYAAVGSYMVRVIRIFDMRFTNYPPFWLTAALAVTIYVNFFSHHFTLDLRIPLFVATVLIFGRVRIWFTTDVTPRWMPLVLAALLTAFFLWVAENIGTYTGTWLYPGQGAWKPVSLSKLGAWYLLLFISFVLVTIVVKPMPPDQRPVSGPIPG